jgi:hypothetical protein
LSEPERRSLSRNWRGVSKLMEPAKIPWTFPDSMELKRRGLERLDWRRDKLDSTGRWFYAYGCPSELIWFLEALHGCWIDEAGGWAYYLPQNSIWAIIRGTVRKLSYSDWKGDRPAKEIQSRL